MTGTELLYQHYLKNPLICTDTRRITPGCLFFALRGDKFDANTFAEQALTMGAAYAVVDNIKYKTSDRCILVPDVLSALQDLARHHRSKLNIPVVGLTGTNGKTTTKELINAALLPKYRTFATQGNLNNHIGVPLSILSIPSGTEIAVIEMGANHQKEIEFLCGIADPTHGMITNVGMAHLEGFGGFEGVKKGKGELYTYLANHGREAFVNQDNAHLKEMGRIAGLQQIISYGKDPGNDVWGELLTADPLISLFWSDTTGTYNASVNLTGAYNFENILAAICIANYFGVSAGQIAEGLAGYHPNNNRSQLTETSYNKVICDFYNANPSSMSAALGNLGRLTANRKVIIIGDMFELGNESETQHANIAGEAAAVGADELYFVGEAFSRLRDKQPGRYFATPAEALDYFQEHPVRNSLVLLKGSRGMALEQLLPLL
ncbi:UDP-N-acetylmuramoyl-tripeptide--D-alanyl-D-alanine ligase [Pedobacter deserti]|uniref:UDP-N-acetylmuramoyl-tripeptide--D-alanyl-D- alanine ligase n=1 Tax=Pedobacter deserti TaxID=2817382 RepID=UPI00210B629A|nr:UDP-N-acetylmuramoyl-tripeptide--D-alanyl-D-alanine ligase [Pedobacter sp. SYSU D00382]